MARAQLGEDLPVLRSPASTARQLARNEGRDPVWPVARSPFR